MKNVNNIINHTYFSVLKSSLTRLFHSKLYLAYSHIISYKINIIYE